MPKSVLHTTFLKDVFQLSISCFGGPQAHLANYQRILVERGQYLSREDLFELYALCQVLPGPTSTQTLTSVGYRIGGAGLAYITLIIWALPSMLIMAGVGLLVIHFQVRDLSLGVTRFIQPMAVGFVGYAAYTISLKTVNTRIGIVIMVVSAVMAYFAKTPLAFPIILLGAGMVTALNYKLHPKAKKKTFSVPWANFFLWLGIFVAVAIVGGITKSLPIRLFENFYRNGSLIFGGGQVLAPLLYTEFVQYAPKQYLSSQEFLLGYAVIQAVPGPLFSFSAYVGALSMKGTGVGGEMLGAIMATAGVFLPGTFFVFFAIRIWDSLKRFRPIRASLDGINSANAGLVIATAILLFQPLENNFTNFWLIIGTFGLLAFSQLPSWVIIGLGLASGFIFS